MEYKRQLKYAQVWACRCSAAWERREKPGEERGHSSWWDMICRVAGLLGSCHYSLLADITCRVLPVMTGVWTLGSCQMLELPQGVSSPSMGILRRIQAEYLGYIFK